MALKDPDGYVTGVLPATHHIDFRTIRQALDSDLEMVDEEELVTVFYNYDIVSTPPTGIA